MKKQDFVSFVKISRKERLAILSLITMLLFASAGYVYWNQKMSTVGYLSLRTKGLESIQSTLSLGTEHTNSQTTDTQKKIKSDFKKFQFDPHLIDARTLVKFEVPAKTAATWVNFVKKGGKFKTLEDLLKIYGLTQHDLRVLSPYVLFPTSDENIVSKKKKIIDINAATSKELIELGWPESVARIFNKYRSKGVIFYSKEDMSKVKVLDDTLISMILPFVSFAEKPNGQNQEAEEDNHKTSGNGLSINLNTADSMELVKLPGIGAKLASRILKYRHQIGGFYAIHQIGDVYGLADSTIAKIKPLLFVTPTFKKIQVNELDKTPMYHPYISNKQLELLKNYIAEHKPVHHVEDLRDIPLLDSLFWRKITPYLDFAVRP